jgi:hypothetical protein
MIKPHIACQAPFKFHAEMPFRLIFWFDFTDSGEKGGHLGAHRGKAVAWLAVFVMMCYLI